MAIEFPSEEWIQEWCRLLNENERYAELAADWGRDFNGDFIFTIEADDHLDETVHYFVSLEDGGCTEARHVDDPADERYGFEITGPYANWKELSKGELGAIQGLLRGKFELNGDLQRVMQYTNASIEMVESAAAIETDYRY